MSVKFKAILWHALETAEGKEKKGGKELIDLLKDTHILFSVRGRWWTVSWWNELSCGYGSGGDQTWSAMFRDKRPGGVARRLTRLGVWIKVLADLTKQWELRWCVRRHGRCQCVALQRGLRNAGRCQVFRCWMSSRLWRRDLGCENKRMVDVKHHPAWSVDM